MRPKMTMLNAYSVKVRRGVEECWKPKQSKFSFCCVLRFRDVCGKLTMHLLCYFCWRFALFCLWMQGAPAERDHPRGQEFHVVADDVDKHPKSMWFRHKTWALFGWTHQGTVGDCARRWSSSRLARHCGICLARPAAVVFFCITSIL